MAFHSHLSADLPFGLGGSSRMPKMIYGTAWKENRTDALVYKALQAGFKGIDTAGGSEHYNETLVGKAIHRACKRGVVEAEELFVQSKLNFESLIAGGWAQSDNALHQRVLESLLLRSSGFSPLPLSAYILHAPFPRFQDTLRAWRSLESYVPDRIRHLGISNVTLPVLRQLYESAVVKPTIVQNSFSTATDYDVELRSFCRQRGIAYQSFWTFTANRQLVDSVPVGRVAEKVVVSRVAALYSLVLGLQGIAILNGTTSERHMRMDLEAIKKVEIWSEGVGRKDWELALTAFKGLIREV